MGMNVILRGEQKKVDRWNADKAVGVPVTYLKDDGTQIKTATRTPAELLSGHTAVVWVDGIAGCVRLDRISQRP